MPISLGQFDLDQPIGRGGMGIVWGGVHRAQGVPVAIKLMAPDVLEVPELTFAIRNEVRAVARLDHPNIVTVFDMGEVSPAEADQSDGNLIDGQPFIAMELASGGSLEELEGGQPWEVIQALLLALLDALAHAHARNVIHRDLKPGNLLISSGDDARPGLKLTDFGIAHALETQTRFGKIDPTAGSTESAMGSPRYMAPEQFHGAWRDYGPWTDLYALGCIAFHLATGRLPFRGGSLIKLAVAHMHDPVPPFSAEHPMPSGFQGWVLRLLQKDPRERFQCAADAAWSLRRLLSANNQDLVPRLVETSAAASSEPTDVSAVTGSRFDQNHRAIETPMDELGEDIGLGDTELGDTVTLFTHTGENATGETIGEGFRAIEKRPPIPEPEQWSPPLSKRQAPPILPSWRRTEVDKGSTRLLGAGLGLFGLRAIPMVDREELRETLWQELKAVHEVGVPRLVAITGAGGNGKTRLANWLCHRAEETGAASILRASHNPVEAVHDGTAGMLARQLRCVGMNRVDAVERISEILAEEGESDDFEAKALTEFILPSSEDERKRVSAAVLLRTQAERFALLARFLERQTVVRPVIVHIDDAQWGADALLFSRHVLDKYQEIGLPVLFLVTVGDQHLADQRSAKQTLAQVLTRPGASQIELPPLDAADRSELVRHLLGLEGELAASVEERSGGNPLFAVQLVGDWVRRGVLVAGRHGFSLAAGVEPVLAEGLDEVWSKRLDRVIQELSSTEPDPGTDNQAELAIEIAAALGLRVSTTDWEETCEHAGVSLPESLLEVLVSSTLAHQDVDGWAFVSAMLREAVEQRAREANRWSSHSRACVAMLRSRYSDSGVRGVSERLGRYLRDAGELLQAAKALLAGANERRELSEYGFAHALLTEREQLLDQLQVPNTDSARGEGWIVRVNMQQLQGHLNEAHELGTALLQACHDNQWPELLPHAQLRLGAVVRTLGDLEGAELLQLEARENFEKTGDELGQARASANLAAIYQKWGDWKRASELFELANSLFESLNNRLGQCTCLVGLGNCARIQGEQKRAVQLVGKALAIAEWNGDRLSMANCLNTLGDLARVRSDLPYAIELYERSTHHFSAIGSTESIIPNLNIGMACLAQGHYDRARTILDDCRARLDRLQRKAFLGVADVMLLPCYAAASSWKLWDQSLDLATASLAQSGLVDSDIAWAAQLAGRIAQEKGQPGRALVALQLALAQWSKLRRDKEISEVEGELAALS